MGCNYTLSLPKDRLPEGYGAPSTSVPYPCGAFTALTVVVDVELYVRSYDCECGF